MSLDALRDTFPDYAKDIKLNLGSLASDQTLNDQQKWGAFLATAHAIGEPSLLRAIEAEIVSKIEPAAATAAKAAAIDDDAAPVWSAMRTISVAPPRLIIEFVSCVAMISRLRRCACSASA